MIPLDRRVLGRYSDLRKEHPSASKEDCLIAASAIVKRFPLVTRNYRHFRIFRNIELYFQLKKNP